MAVPLNIAGDRFARLVVMSRMPSTKYGKSRWLCRCDCGKEITVNGGSLTSGNTKSCGCLKRDLAARKTLTHGLTGTRTYRIWQAMHNRCRNPRAINYARYGGRGIEVCEAWSSFENFYRDMGECPPGHSIDRTNNDENYSPENCRWADAKTQRRNNSHVRRIRFRGKEKLLCDWANDLGIDQASLRERLEKWPLERALTETRTN